MKWKQALKLKTEITVNAEIRIKLCENERNGLRGKSWQINPQLDGIGFSKRD